MNCWAVVTGGGTGIGAAVAKCLAAKDINVLIVGRRLEPLANVKKAHPGNIHILNADIGTEDGIDQTEAAIPKDAQVKYLIQNAAVGEPSPLETIDRKGVEYAFSVNVIAPLFLTQKFLSKLKLSKGRILHIGTGVAHRAQPCTAAYGITKSAMFRLYEQLKVDLAGTGVTVGSVRPGVVDTEGFWEHYKLAKEQNLLHIKYLDQVKESNQIWDADDVAKFLAYLLMDTNDDEFSAKEWTINDKELWPKSIDI